MSELYDRIGKTYSDYRRPDPRIAAQIMQALGDAQAVVNIGAGAGSYEPRDRRVVAVEPSLTMIRQRPADAAPVVCASAMDLPFRDGSFDSALAILTIHHWPDQARGLQEMARVAHGRCVILTWEPPSQPSWLTRDYFPEIREYDRILFPPAENYRSVFPHSEIIPVPIPHDCIDGFLEAYWRRPEAYLDPGARSAISAFNGIDTRDGLERLRRDLADGTWLRRNGALLQEIERDLGYRLIVAES